jgi:tetraacyldisaccharide 4'-kinase
MENKLKEKISSIMVAEEPNGSAPLRALLRTISVFYGAGVRLRGAAFGCRLKSIRKLPCFVISIGNITVGGTGKTPMVIYIAKTLRGLGYQVAVLSRGYRGSAEKNGGMVSDGHRLLMEPEAAGDEPFMLASDLLADNIPVMVGRDRVRSGLLAVGHFRPHVILLDDGFQHRRLHRDLDIVLLDGRRPLGNGHLFPRGTLREPPPALKRAGLVILTRSDRASTDLQEGLDRLRQLAPQRHVFRCRHQPYVSRSLSDAAGMPKPDPLQPETAADSAKRLGGKRVYGFSGIANNPDFRQTLTDLGAEVGGFKSFADHHPYSADDLRQLQNEARKCGCDSLATTQKDYCRFRGRLKLALDLIVIDVRIDFGDQRAAFSKALADRLPALV